MKDGEKKLRGTHENRNRSLPVLYSLQYKKVSRGHSGWANIVREFLNEAVSREEKPSATAELQRLSVKEIIC